MKTRLLLAIYGILTFLLVSCENKNSSTNSTEYTEQSKTSEKETQCFPEYSMYSEYKNIEFHSAMLDDKPEFTEGKIYGHNVGGAYKEQYMNWRLGEGCGILYYFITVTFQDNLYGQVIEFSSIGSGHFRNLTGEALIKEKDEFVSLSSSYGRYPTGYTIYVCDGLYSFASDMRQNKLNSVNPGHYN